MVPLFTWPVLEVLLSVVAVTVAADVPGIDSIVSPLAIDMLGTAGEIKPMGSYLSGLEVMFAAVFIVFEVLVFEFAGTKGVELVVVAVDDVWGSLIREPCSLCLALFLLVLQADSSRSVEREEERERERTITDHYYMDNDKEKNLWV